jgi:hypothetical protein
MFQLSCHTRGIDNGWGAIPKCFPRMSWIFTIGDFKPFNMMDDIHHSDLATPTIV